MNFDKLLALGFSVTGEGPDARITAELMTPFINPLTRRFIDRIEFKPLDGQLAAVRPPELVGIAPQTIAGVERFSEFETQLRAEFDRAVLQMQRRSAELQAFGLQPQVDPETLELKAELRTPTLLLQLAADRQGNFRVAAAERAGEALPVPAHTRFDLGEFREGSALVAYLETLVLELSGQKERAPQPERSRTPAAVPAMVRPISVGDLEAGFGARAVIPQKTAIEIVADLRLGDERYRFAASRVVGRTFRGLLAGPRGKVWADRFELDAFPGVVALAAEELGVHESDLELIGLDVGG